MVLNGCKVDEEERSSITNADPYSVTVDTADQTVPEESNIYTVNFTLSENQITDADVLISVDPESTATEDVDFHILNTHVIVPAYSRVGSFDVEILEDLDQEGDEVAIFSLGNGADGPFGIGTAGRSSITITDRVNTDLFLNFDWDGVVDYAGNDTLGVPAGMYPICGNVDLDVYVLDADGADMGIYDAATGACPENMIISGWADGVYTLASNMWENGYAGLGANVPWPITVSFFKPGNPAQANLVSFVTTDNWTSEDLDQANGGNADFKGVATITVTGTTYKVELPDGSVIFEGLKANNPNK